MTDAAEMAEWSSRCMEMHFSFERMVQAVLATENATAIKRMSEWLHRHALLAAELDAIMTPGVAAT